MIPFTELRIGNYVLVDQTLQRILMVDSEPAQASGSIDVNLNGGKEGANFPLKNIEPVALTDDILRQCHFVYHDYFKFWQLINGKDENRSEMDIDSDYNVIDYMRRPLVKKVSTLHQLQNIYFMLKGKELSFRETA